MEAIIILVIFIFIMAVFGKNNGAKNYRTTSTRDKSTSKLRQPSTYRAARQRTPKYRVSHCFSCQTTVDSREDNVCPDCNWIACSTCGACSPNCHYEHYPKSSRPKPTTEDRSPLTNISLRDQNEPFYREGDDYEYRRDVVKVSPRDFSADGDSFYKQLEKDIDESVLLSDYQLAILKRFKPFIKRTEAAYPMFIELLEERRLPSTYYITPILALLNEHSMRKQQAWWHTSNESIQATDYFDDSPMGDAKSDYLDEQERRDDEARREMSQYTSGLSESN